MDIEQVQTTFLARAGERLRTMQELCSEGVRENLTARQEQLREISGIAFALRSQAQSLGYEFMAEMAGSLSHFCEHAPQSARSVVIVLDQHLNVLQAIIIHNLHGDGGPYAADVLSSLQKLIRLLRNKAARV